MRKKETDALISCGIPMNQSGFIYIVDIMQLYEENGAPMTNMEIVYRMIAKIRNREWQDVMENIRYSIDFGRDNCLTGEWNKYFGLTFTPKTIGNCLANMYMRLKEEE